MRKYIVVILLFISVGVAAAAPVEWLASAGGNGHYYEKYTGSFTWDEARALANAKTYDPGTGALQGYLVTITSAGENLFLTNDPALGDGVEVLDGSGNYVSGNLLHFYWTGGYQPPGSTEPGGGWSWVTGEAFSYNNWGGFYDPFPNITRTEPNNSFGTEDRIVFDGGFLTDGKNWNDLTGTWHTSGYVVEYGEYSDTAVIPTVPEPATMLLLGLGLMGLVPIRKKLLK